MMMVVENPQGHDDAINYRINMPEINTFLLVVFFFFHTPVKIRFNLFGYGRLGRDGASGAGASAQLVNDGLVGGEGAGVGGGVGGVVQLVRISADVIVLLKADIIIKLAVFNVGIGAIINFSVAVVGVVSGAGADAVQVGVAQDDIRVSLSIRAGRACDGPVVMAVKAVILDEESVSV